MIPGVNKKHAAAAFALGFMAALILSGLGVRFYSRAHRNPAQFKAHILNKMDKKLRLEDAQRQQISEILDQKFAEVRAVRESSRAQHDRIQKSARSQIREILTDAQKEPFDAFNKKMDERRARRRGRSKK